MTVMPYGTWQSPLSAADLAAATISLSDLTVDGQDLYWIASRPDEGGRYAVMHRDATGAIQEVSPPGYSARTRVHEYGGGALGAGHGVVLACSWTDQRVHRLDRGAATPITPEPQTPAGIRWAAMRVLPEGRAFVAIRETHGPDRPRQNDNIHGNPEAVNELVTVDLANGASSVLVTGPDFIGGPWVNPGGTRLAWLQWDHPDMPWDTAQLWTAPLLDQGRTIGQPVHIAGGRDSAGRPFSVADALWLDEERLAFTADPDGWWNVHVWTGGVVSRLQDDAVESGFPRWVHSVRSLASAGDQLFAVTLVGGYSHVRRICGTSGPATDRPDADPTGTDPGSGALSLDGIGAVGELTAMGRHLIAIAGGPSTPTAVIRIDPDSQTHEVLAGPTEDPAARIGAIPQPITFPTTDDAVAHGLYYPPTGSGVTAPAGERPPLIVLSHGGPTGAARTSLNAGAQYWTSRGFAVVDVNYRGSVGYGRAYRDALIGNWGRHDRDDCIAAAAHLADQGMADPDRLIIEGGSAGGYTTLLALCTTDTFAAGGSLFGVADLRALATDTHKFESRYLDSMIGPWPAEEATYIDRSPITHVGQLDTPMIVLQGDEDAVVPPAQAEMIVSALRERGIPHAYLLFEGEQHGFRDPKNIIRSIEARLAFYGRVVGIDIADEIDLPEYVPGR